MWDMYRAHRQIREKHANTLLKQKMTFVFGFQVNVLFKALEGGQNAHRGRANVGC